MTSAQIVDSKGNKVREVGLDESIFGVEPDKGLLHAALIRQLANARRGTASTKTRAEVSGGGKKPWRQKGTGRARAGSIRSPLWEGGGVAFGPKPRDFSIAMPKKQRVLALKAALAARKDDMMIVQSFDDIKNGKTKEFVKLLSGLKLDEKKVLLILDGANEKSHRVELAARNVFRLTVVRREQPQHQRFAQLRDGTHCRAHTRSNQQPVSMPSGKNATEPGAAKGKKKPAAATEKKAAKAPKKEAADKEPKAKGEKPAAKAAKPANRKPRKTPKQTSNGR